MTTQVSDNGVTLGSPNLHALAYQHPSISATAAANAITVTLSPCTLSFRSTTLTSGVPSILEIGSALTSVVAATDSFGLVTADGVQRFAVLVFNDGGTPRLAVSRLSGGVNLDETNLLSATSTATTSTSIDCGANVTSKAYRVVGFYDAAFVTATGWTTQPSLVQPAGGQSFTSLSSLGYGQTWQNVGGSRVSGTTYYNTTGKPITVSVSAAVSAGNSVTPTVNGISFGGTSFNGSSGSTAFMVVVPPGGSYSFAIAGSISTWLELR